MPKYTVSLTLDIEAENEHEAKRLFDLCVMDNDYCAEAMKVENESDELFSASDLDFEE